MQIQVITNEASFFREVYAVCRQTCPQLVIVHKSEEHWAVLQTLGKDPRDLLIGPPCESRLYGDGQNFENAFAVLGSVCQNTKRIHWNPLTRNDFILWLRELSPMTREATIIEDVVFQTPHVRLAQLRIGTACRLIPVLRDRLMRGLRDYRVVEGTRENHFCMALEEALNNAFYHGNLQISSELKEDGSSRYIELAAERELLAPWCHRSVYVTELVSAFGLWITIRDEGRGFNVAAAIERCNDPEALLASGRGLLLMRGFSDEMFFNVSGNEVTLVLYADGQNREMPLGTANSAGPLERHVFV